MKRLLYILPLLLLFSCERLFIPPDKEVSNQEVFESLWKTVDEKYSFFELKNLDWDSVHTVYDAQVTETLTEFELFDIMGEMLFTLRDGHVNLSGGFDFTRNWEWYLDYPQNFNYTVLERNYLGDDYRITGPLVHTNIGNVGYMYYGSFSDRIDPSFMDYILIRYQNMNGLIIDLRDNGGGTLSNAYRIANHFTTEKRHVADWYYKVGPGHDEFSEAVPKYLEPEGEYWDKPVVVLTNRSCYSATNFFVSMMSQLPNVTIIGDKTGGGGGLPIGQELPNGWYYRFSSTQTLEPNGFNIELGIEPDFYVDIDLSDVDSDEIIDAAITLLVN